MRSDPVIHLTPAAALALSGVSKRFGDFTALHEIELNVHKGEFVCLLGPSGCGKTTLLRIIAGLDSADRGRIDMHGQDVTRMPPAKRDYGIVFQSYALFPNLTVTQNIAYGLKGRRQDRRQRVSELLQLIGLAGIEARYPNQLSGGSNNGWPWHARLPPPPACCCWTNRCQRWMHKCANICAAKFAACNSGLALPPSW